MTIEVSAWNLLIRMCLMVGLILMTSCQEDKPPAPSDLLPEDRFVEVLVDLNLIEAVRSMHITKEKENKAETEEFYNELWERTDISEAQFKSSFEYYQKDPEKMAEFYERVSELIKRKEDLLNEQKRNISIEAQQ